MDSAGYRLALRPHWGSGARCLPFHRTRMSPAGLWQSINKASTMLQITWLGHGTFQLRLSSGEVLLLDPWTEGNPAYPPGHEIDEVKAILISHGHFDHIHDAVSLAKKFTPQM